MDKQYTVKSIKVDADYQRQLLFKYEHFLREGNIEMEDYFNFREASLNVINSLNGFLKALSEVGLNVEE